MVLATECRRNQLKYIETKKMVKIPSFLFELIVPELN